MSKPCWWCDGNLWLRGQMGRHMLEWCETEDGRRWVKGVGPPSDFGYVRPAWIVEAWEALTKVDEERFARIRKENERG